MSDPIFYQTVYGDRVDGIVENAKEQIIEAKEKCIGGFTRSFFKSPAMPMRKD